ncbi:MAG: hypothetical protein GX047_07000 [Firmicutes bacterium]|nr:hypothetical protein [Bacillota bacterium]
MGQRIWRPGKRTVLRLGDKGLPVIWLQERLKSLAYEVEVDGVYGYLTEDCVCSLQREYGLRVDGIAGPQVLELLHDKDIQAGTPRCQVWGAVHGGRFWQQLERKSYADARQKLTGMFLYCFRVSENGDVVGELPKAAASDPPLDGMRLIPVISNYNQDLYDEPALEALLKRRDLLRRFQELARRLLANPRLDGIALDLQGVGMGYGRRFAALAAGVRKLADTHGKGMYMVLIPADEKRVLPRIIETSLWKLPDRVIFQAPWEQVVGEPGPRMGYQWLQKELARVCRHLPAWKLMVSLPGNGIAWYVGENQEYNYLSYDEARKLAYLKQATIRWDGLEKISYYDFADEKGRCRVWFENKDSLKWKLDWLKGQHVTGIVISPLGCEDTRIWEEISR